MDIKLDVSFLPTEIRSSIIKNVQAELSQIESMEIDFTKDSGRLYTVRWASESLKEFKYFLENILRNNCCEEYVVAEDTTEINTITILKQGDVEQFGMHMCTHCGTIFKSVEEKAIHEKIHYFM